MLKPKTLAAIGIIIALMVGGGVVMGQQTSACITGGAVASGNAGLAADCEALLDSKDTLRGTADLNWSSSLSIRRWDGVRLGGTPERVTIIRLQKKGLSGQIPAALGRLDALEELWLYDNELTDAIPPEMGNLTNLRWLFVSTNSLSGQIPETLNSLTLDRLWLQQNDFTGCVPYNLTQTREYKVDRGLPACALLGNATPTPAPPGATPTPVLPQPTPSGDRLGAIEGRLSDVERRVAALEADMARLLATPTPTSTPTPGPSPTPEPTPTPTPTPDLGTQQLPVPFGTTFTIQNSTTDHWEFTILKTTPDATSDILNHSRYNDPPAPGNQFYMVRVRAKYLGTGSEKFGYYSRLKSLGEGGVVYSWLRNNCGSVPDRLPDPELFKNGQIEGNQCWEIASSDADSLVLIVEPDSSRHSRHWFSLTPSP